MLHVYISSNYGVESEHLEKISKARTFFGFQIWTTRSTGEGPDAAKTSCYTNSALCYAISLIFPSAFCVQ
jgi:hypothetical protein